MTLVSLVLIPLAAATVIATMGRSAAIARVLALVAGLVTLVASGAVWREYAVSAGRLTYELTINGSGSFVSLAADGLAVPLITLTAVLGVIAVLASWDVDRTGPHMALLLTLEAAVMGVFLAADLIVFYVAWEAVLIPMFFLIGGWGHENRRHAAMKFFVYTFAGSALMLVGLVVLLLNNGGSSAMNAAAAPLPAGLQTLVFWLLAAGFLVKIPVVPLHTWLPDAHVEAPTAGSIMLAGVLLKMGAYGLMRVCAPFTPDALSAAAPVLFALGVAGIVYGAAMALGQRDLKRLVAYSSVAHMGFVVLGIAAGTELGYQGAVLGMVSHGLVAGLLFFLVGALYERAHTRDIGAFGGLGRTLPKWATVFVVASLASLGLPGLSGFPGEFAAVVAAFGRFGRVVAVAGVGVVLAGAYTLRAVRAVVHGEPGARTDGAPRTLADLTTREMAVCAALLALIIAIGVWPRFVTDIASATLGAIASLAGTVG